MVQSLDLNELEKKIDLITHDASKPYFSNAFKRLDERIILKTLNIICDYITAETN